ncbi:MAG: 3-hydroxyacyl-ACP dehydratase FabZ family protein [Bacteroidota bacterium]
MTTEKILSLLPYTHPFLFVDSLEKLDDEGVVGTYTYPASSYFYQGHFINYPITPGVILTETMAQIGLVCLGLFLMKDKIKEETTLPAMVMVSNETNYFLPVYPGEKVKVISKKVYFRFGKLKCQVEMRNAQNKLVCKGAIAGMIANN